MIVLTFKDSEEEMYEKVITASANDIQLETIQSVLSPVLSYPGLEIRLH